MAKKVSKEIVVKENQVEYSLDSVFSQGSNLTERGFKVKTLAPIIKPHAFPVGAVLEGEVVALIPLKKFEYGAGKKKEVRWGYGVEIKPASGAMNVVLPITGVIGNAIGFNEEEVDLETGKGATCEVIGKEIAIQKLAEKIPSKKGNDAWNFVVGIKD